MTTLGAKLAALIRANGPISVEAFMQHALYDPAHGYYRQRQPLGAAGDFITAPEISQMFGELIGLWCAERWLTSGQPVPCALIELGPGKGTMMADIVRASTKVPGFADASRLKLVETSPGLQRMQAARLPQAQFHDRLADIAPGFSLIVANEFLDALPIRQFVRTSTGWRERGVGFENDSFTPLALTDPPDFAALLPSAFHDAPQGAIFERNFAAEAVMAEIGQRIANDGGWALLIDYGPAAPALGETLQALRAHRPAPVFAAPGAHDLTAHVDFTAMARAAREAGAAVFGPISQGQLLERLGIDHRADALKRGQDARGRAAIEAARQRLIAPAQMGTLFKAIAVGPEGAAPPPGFEAAPS